MTRPLTYAGIGSRETPGGSLNAMELIGAELGKIGWILRSGAAPGADSAFERGADSVAGKKEIFLPWQGFGGRYRGPGVVVVSNREICVEAERLAAAFHPKWSACSPGARTLHSRNVFQILGADLQSSTDFVICWTVDASGKGGTGQAIRIARHFKIPVFDIAALAQQNALLAYLGPYAGQIKFTRT